MTLGITVWNERIAPVFDSAATVWILDIRDDVITNRASLNLRGMDLHDRANALARAGAFELICGAISCQAESALRMRHVHALAFVAGEAETVVSAYLKGELTREEYSMPGCHRARRRRGQC